MSDAPMLCRDATPYLAALADDELAEPLRAQVAAHVASCTACAAEVRRHEAIRTVVATLPRSAPSPEVLDRVLAASRSAGPSGIVRESLRGRQKRLVPRELPGFLRAATAPPVARPIGPPRHSRSVALRALPMLAAALLITFSVVAFSRFSASNRFGSHTAISTPQSLASVVETTQRAVDAKRGALSFSPTLPTYLPAGAAFASASIGAEPADASRRYLDITWTIVLPASTLHLRESPLPLTARSDFLSAGPANPALTWSVGQYQWSSGDLPSQNQRCAVGEDRGDYSVVLDVGMQSPGLPCDSSDNAKAINVLRLASLSLGVQYQPFSALPPDLTTSVLHFRASAAPGAGASWEVYADPAHHRISVTVRDEHGQVVYVDHISGSGVTRLDPAARTYATLAGGAGSLGEPTALPGDVIAFFNSVNAFLSAGELWKLGPDAADPAHRVRLALVGAPYPTTLYVDPVSRRVVGAVVDYGASTRPGGPNATSRLTQATRCPPAFATIDFLASGKAPASVFDFSTSGYAPGRVPQTIGC